LDAFTDHMQRVCRDARLVCGAGSACGRAISLPATVDLWFRRKLLVEALGRPQRPWIKAAHTRRHDLGAATLLLRLVGIVAGASDAVRLGNHAGVMITAGCLSQAFAELVSGFPINRGLEEEPEVRG